MKSSCISLLTQTVLLLVYSICAADTSRPQVPGKVIDHSPASSGIYLGSPSITILTNDTYLVSHDEFGPKSSEYQVGVTRVFRSMDAGETWQPIARIEGAYWSTLITHQGSLYLMGTDRHSGNIVIRQSIDGGISWSRPKDQSNGLLRSDRPYHCAPVPILVAQGRIWRAFECQDPTESGGGRLKAGLLSAPIESDLLKSANWRESNFVNSDPKWNGGDMENWLEGNAIQDPSGRIFDLLRVQTQSSEERAALVSVSNNGQHAAFDPMTGLISFPGGAKKFTVRFDPISKLFWAIVTPVTAINRAPNPGSIRNALGVSSSPDLRNWSLRRILLYHPDSTRHGFQYVDWLFSGKDIIAACRTSYDDEAGGAHNFHDSNFVTFHRFEDFRSF